MARETQNRGTSKMRLLLKNAIAIFALLHVLFLTQHQLPGEESKTQSELQKQAQKERLLKMRKIAESIQTASLNGEQYVPVELIAHPLFRFSDSARGYSDGTIWAWGKTGRPVAILTVSRITTSIKGFKWIYELTSLSGNRVISEGKEGWKWTPRNTELDLKPIPDSPSVAGSPAKRLRQLKQLARRFEADEFYRPKSQSKQEWYKLRLLPQPIHRYSTPDAKVRDGALFVFAYGTNPEIILEIVSTAKNQSSPTWHYRCVRTSAAELRIRLNDSEVWHQSKIVSGDPQKQYFTTASKGEIDERSQ